MRKERRLYAPPLMAYLSTLTSLLKILLYLKGVAASYLDYNIKQPP